MKKNAFTLAEGATHTNMLQRVGNGFTLAEVLITLAIIGVVAAMTIPTLIAKINDIVTTNQAKVFNAKLIKGLNLTKTAGDLNDTYTSTYDFLVNGLGKNLKMAKVCDSDHIRDCIPYDKIKYDKSGTEDTVNVADIKNAGKLNLEAPYEDTAAFVLADGTPVIVSYNKQCIDDPDKADTTINGCLAGIYDLNGTRKPNRYEVILDTDGKTVKSYVGDLRAFNGASIGSSCTGQIGDLCLVSTLIGGSNSSYQTMLAAIKAKDQSYTMPTYSQGDDHWQLANDYCNKVKKGARLSNSSDLAKIARVLYKNNSISDANSSNSNSGLNWDSNKAEIFAALGVTDNPSGFELWSSSQPIGTGVASYRYFNRSSTGYENYSGRSNSKYAVCIGG